MESTLRSIEARLRAEKAGRVVGVRDLPLEARIAELEDELAAAERSLARDRYGLGPESRQRRRGWADAFGNSPVCCRGCGLPIKPDETARAVYREAASPSREDDPRPRWGYAHPG